MAGGGREEVRAGLRIVRVGFAAAFLGLSVRSGGVDRIGLLVGLCLSVCSSQQ